MTYRMKNSIIRDPKGRIKFRRPAGAKNDLYHIGVWLEADSPAEMDRVTKVEYLLHPSFANRLRSSANRRNDFSITFWAWGFFEIEATVYLAGGEANNALKIKHLLDVNLPSDTGTNYVQVN